MEEVEFWQGKYEEAMKTIRKMKRLSYLVFMPKQSTHRMHHPGSNVPHIRPKVLTDNQIS
jgi:hypothetical protein